MERKTGFEPATLGLGSRCSTYWAISAPIAIILAGVGYFFKSFSQRVIDWLTIGHQRWNLVYNKSMRKTRRGFDENIWKNFGQIWDISWMTVAPIILGLFLGQYLDREYPKGFSWTLSMLILGIFFAFYNLYQFFDKEIKKYEKKDKKNEHDNKSLH